MSEVSESPEKADSESRCSTPRSTSIASLDFDESSKSERRVKKSSRSSTPVTKTLRPRGKVSESPGGTRSGNMEDDDDTMDEGPLVEKRKNADPSAVLHDPHCWTCHKEIVDDKSKDCESCLRSFHPKCIPSARTGHLPPNPDKWECPECAPFVYEPPPRSKGTQEQLNVLFKYLIDRAVGTSSEPFMNPVDLKEFPQYLDYIVNPICISEIEEKLDKELYNCPRQLLADFKWIYHNSVIFNSAQAKLTSIARQMVRVAREETKEIENCPNCLYNAYSMQPDWFIQACGRPHLLVWAKMKGFPYWPAKAMSFNQAQTLVDVRFFGKHDRAYLPIVDCMLYTSWYPAPAQVKKPREDVAACIKEVDQHIEKLKEKFGSFVYASNITFLNPKDMEGQVKKMLPNYKPEDPEHKKPSTPIKSPASQSGISTMKPSVVLTRLSSVDSKTSTPHGSPAPAPPPKSASSSRKNSMDEDSNQAAAPKAVPSPASQVVAEAASPTTSTNPTLKRKMGPASKVAGRATPLAKSNLDKNPEDSDDLAREFEAMESGLSDSEDDIDNYIEDDMMDVPAKKAKQDVPPEKAATASQEHPSKDEPPKGPKTPLSKERQKKIADGIKALDSLKMYGLDVVPVAADAAAASPSYVDMSSDSSEFIESDREESEKEAAGFKMGEEVEVMEVEPDLALPPVAQPKSKMAAKVNPVAKKNISIMKPANKKLEPAKTQNLMASKQVSPQSLLKANNVPNKARKTLANSSILSQRLSKPSQVKQLPNLEQKKQIIVTQTMNSAPSPTPEPLKIDINVPPDSVGPASAMLNATAENIADFMKQAVYSLITDLAKNNEDDLKTENANLKLQLDVLKWQQQQAITEIKRNHEISLQELDVLVEENSLRARLECQRIANEELRKAVNEAKRKTWCAVCLVEASLYCCWNTSYCSVACQKKHWLEHKSTCRLKHQNKSEMQTAFHNGPAKSIVYVTNPVTQSNGGVAANTKKAATALPPHAVFGTSAEVTAALPQLLAVTPSQGDKAESGMRTATHFLMTPASGGLQVKLPAAIHHTSLPATIATRPVQTLAKPASATQQVTTTPLFQFYKESTE